MALFVALLAAITFLASSTHAEVLFTENYESQDWESRWESPHWGRDGVMERVTNHPRVLEGKHSLRIKLKMRGGNVENRVLRRFFKDKGHSRLFMRWYQLIENGPFFIPTSRLQLKGNALYGWIPGNQWPQNLDTRNPKFTFRASMRSFNGIYIYGYYGGMGKVGRIGYTDQATKLKPDTWNCIEIELSGNTIGKRDGALRMWIDGDKTAEKLGLSLREDSRMRILAIEDNFRLDRYMSSGFSSADATVWRDALVVATERIGCDLSTTEPTEPPTPPINLEITLLSEANEL